MSLINEVKDLFNDDFVISTAKSLGESRAAVEKAIHGIVPAFIGLCIEKFSDGSRQQLVELLSALEEEKPMSSREGEGLEEAMDLSLKKEKNQAVFNLLLDGREQELTEFVAGMSGLKTASAQILLHLFGPDILRWFREKIQEPGDEDQEVLEKLSAQTIKTLPTGLENLLNLTFAGGKRRAPDALVATSNKSPKHSSSVLFIFIVLLAVAAAIYFLNQRPKESSMPLEEAIESVVDSIEQSIDLSREEAIDIFSQFDKDQLDVLPQIKFIAGSAGAQMMRYIESGYEENPTFRFKTVHFDAGETGLDSLATVEIDQLAILLNAYPKVKIEIHGHTDNQGDPMENKKVSTQRARAVLAHLLRGQVEKSRMKAIGFGDERPVADNENEAGRAQNRRIEIRLVK